MNASGPVHVAVGPEKRLATFLRCDIVDSTRVLNALALEDQRALTHAFRAAVARVAAREGGHVMRYEGDGAQLSFGHPEPQEDAAECAVRSALALVAEIESIRAVPGVSLRLRVGVASGEVAVGDFPVDSDRVEHAVDGPVLSIAERLRAAGEPGTVVVSDATRRLCGRFFDYVDLGVVAAKGFEQGLHAWRVTGNTSVESSFEARRFNASEGPIVGREAERAILAEAWREALAGRGRALALVGDAGMGKSRLAYELQRSALADGATVLRVDCTPRTRNTPLFPIGVLLRRLAGIIPTTRPAAMRDLATGLLERALGPDEARQVLPYLAPLFGVADVTLPEGLMPNEVRDQTVAGIVRLLGAIGSQRSIFILCEDLHWADATTLAVLEHVARQVGEMRCLLLVTCRSTADAAVDWSRLQRVELPPLAEAEATRLAHAVNRTVGDDVVARIVARGSGVPLFIVEIASEVDEALRLGRAPSVASVPESLKLVVQSRLARWPALKPIVQAASVLGREFPVSLLERMLPERRHEVGPTLSLLGQHGIFRREDPSSARVEFRHAVIRDAVYDTLLRDDRRHWHSLAADELSTTFASSADASADALADHLVESQRFSEAVRIRVAGAAETAARGAFVESVGHCDAALALLDRLADDPEQANLRVALLVQRAVALSAQHGFGAEVVKQAYELAEKHATPGVPDVLRYSIARGLAGVRLIRGELVEAHASAAQGLEIAERSGSPAHRLDALSMRLYTTLYAGTLGECRALVDEFMQLYAASDGENLRYPAPQDAKTAVISLVPTIAWLLGDAAAAEQAIQEGLAHVERLRRPYDQAMLHAWIAGVRYTQRRFAESAQHAMTAVMIATPRGYADWQHSGGLLALQAQAALEPTRERIEQVRGACAMFDAAGVALNASWHRWAIAQACEAIGDHATAQAVLDEGRARAKASRETRLDAELSLLEARLPHNAARAPELLRAAIASAEALGDVVTALRAAAALALLEDAHAESERVRAARHALSRLASVDAGAADGRWMARSLADLTRREAREESSCH